MNAKEVAKLLGTHPENVRRWIREGKIKANKKGRSFDIPQGEVNLLMAHKLGGELNAENERASYTLISDYTSKIEMELNHLHFVCRGLGNLFEEENFDDLPITEQFEKLKDMYMVGRFSNLFKTVRKIDKYQEMIFELEEVAKESAESNSFEKVQEGHWQIENFHKMLAEAHGDDEDDEEWEVIRDDEE